MTITEKTLQVYNLRFEQGFWANITLDAGHESGRLSIASDWGTWSYYWGSCGETFSKFLSSLDIEYMARKFNEANYVDVLSTIRLYSKLILEGRRAGDITALDARLAFAELKELRSCGAASFTDDEHYRYELLRVLQYPSSVRIVSPRFREFYTMAWKPFIEHLKTIKTQ